MAKILTYWRAVEMFDPRDIPRETKRPEPGKERVEAFRLREGEAIAPLPWEQAHRRFGEQPDPSRFGSEWRYTVYGGVFRFGAVRRELERVLGYKEDEDYAGSRRDAVSAAFAFTVDSRGVLLDGTVAISSCAWAAGRVHSRRPGAPGWLDGFEQEADDCAEAMARLLAKPVRYPDVSQSPSWRPSPARPGSDGGTAAEAGARAPDVGDGGAAADGPGWQGAVTDALGAAAAAAVVALLGTVGAVVGGPVGAAALGAAAGSAIDRLTKRAERAEQAERAEREAQADRSPADSAAGASASATARSTPATAPSTAPEGPAGPAAPPSTDHADGAPDERPVLMPDLVGFAAHVASVLNLPAGLANHLELRVVCTPVYRKKDGSLPDPDPVFLTSLLAPDLKRVADSAPDGFGPALASYLSDPEPASGRLDLRTAQGRGRVLAGLRPERFPEARWPADTSRKLVAGQQFAVNEIVAELAGGNDGAGLFAVNGPPGTGKTTLLRDLIAAVVVRRAEVLATLPSPADGFGRALTWRGADGRQRAVNTVRAGLTGFEIVVASSNNVAAENITKELPALTAIGGKWGANEPVGRPPDATAGRSGAPDGKQADYFAEQATALLGQPAWGLLAAALGKAEKRSEFRQKFWFRERGMRAKLRELRGTARPGDWADAVDRFRTALGAARRLASERGEAAAALQFPISEAELSSARAAAADARHELGLAEADHARALAALAALQQETVRAIRDRDAHLAGQPGGLRARLGLGAALADWRQRADELAGRLQALADDEPAARAAEARAGSVEDAARSAAADRAERLRRLEARQRAEADRVRRARAAWGASFPQDWLSLHDDDRELASPWSDDQWAEARTEVFLAALDLHRAFAAGAAGIFLQNLGHLVDALGRDPNGPPPQQELVAWQTLFLMIPVVSTTFASCGRMFARLGRESLGWLLVDEAGQALPQAAVGALWRSRRAVIVGDPRQLEPISQVPVAVQEKLCQLSSLPSQWVPAGTSAQGLADRRSVLGTEIAADDGRVWVGTPLRVHRRCQKPMFEMSNELAYGGLMVYGTTGKRFPADSADPYPGSCWIDVPGSGPGPGKWVEDQGDALLDVVEKLRSERFGVELKDICVLSPFRDVVRESRHLLTTKLRGPDGEGAGSDELDRVDDFVKQRVGTVHTMQGKEADVVVLVLGTDRARSRKARDWVGYPPNLLNVAVSRAKRRLFVIGDYEDWSDAPNFGVFAARPDFPRQPYRRSQ